MPARGHSFAIDAAGGRAVVFGRQPGFFALGFGLDGAAGPVELDLPQDRHFFGHGAFFDDGRLLAATENDFDGGRGVLGIYDASAGGAYRRVGEFDCGGIGPHEVLLLPDGKTLCVANGGILTHPDYGKLELNLDTMRPSLAYLDAASGKLLERVELDPALHRLSIRHLAVAADGAVWFGCQYMGPAGDRPALVGRHRRGQAPELFPARGCLAPDAQLHRLGRGGRGRRGGGHVQPRGRADHVLGRGQRTQPGRDRRGGRLRRGAGQRRRLPGQQRPGRHAARGCGRAGTAGVAGFIGPVLGQSFPARAGRGGSPVSLQSLTQEARARALGAMVF